MGFKLIVDKKLKILAASDIHGDSGQAKRLAEAADKNNVDLVVLCGDITGHVPTDNIVKPFIDKGKRVLLIPGNHDGMATIDFLSDLYKVKNLHKNYAVYSHVGLFGCGLANCGLESCDEDEFYEILKEGFLKIKDSKKKIMVTHIHPEGTIIDRIEPGLGSSGVRRAIDTFKPDLLLCGHVHSAAGVEDNIGNTRVVNVGRNGKIIEL